MLRYKCYWIGIEVVTIKLGGENENTNVDTTTAVSRKSSTVDEQSSPAMVPHHHTKPNKPKVVLPSAKTQTEPISLELFNCAAADLDKKGEIELECYKKYLFNRD